MTKRWETSQNCTRLCCRKFGADPRPGRLLSHGVVMVNGQGVCIVMQHEAAEGNGECFLSSSMFITYNTCFFDKHFNQCLANIGLSQPVVTVSTSELRVA